MEAIQLELNINEWSDQDVKFAQIQKQLDAMNESVGKVRRKLFSQMCELQKLCFAIKQENDILKERVNLVEHGKKTDWVYQEGNCLFDVREYQA